MLTDRRGRTGATDHTETDSRDRKRKTQNISLFVSAAADTSDV